MRCIAAVLATICIVAASEDRSCGKSGTCVRSMCGPLEIPVTGNPQRDDFCRPLFTPPWELRKLRSCVCKRGYLRNSWGECIPRVKCIPCKFRWQRDYRMCAPSCPATCNKPFSASCNLPCSAGCVCPPGWVVHPKNSKMCIKAYMCLPKCPPNSSFQACVSSCLPKCGRNPPRKCDLSCERGACVCNKGYIELDRGGKKTCVLQTLCLWYARTTPLFQHNATEHTGGTERSPNTTTLAGGVTTHTGYAGFPIAPFPSNGARTHLEGTPSRGPLRYSGGASSAGTEGTLPAVTVPEHFLGSDSTRSFGAGGNTSAGMSPGTAGREAGTGGAMVVPSTVGADSTGTEEVLSASTRTNSTGALRSVNAAVLGATFSKVEGGASAVSPLVGGYDLGSESPNIGDYGIVTEGTQGGDKAPHGGENASTARQRAPSVTNPSGSE